MQKINIDEADRISIPADTSVLQDIKFKDGVGNTFTFMRYQRTEYTYNLALVNNENHKIEWWSHSYNEYRQGFLYNHALKIVDEYNKLQVKSINKISYFEI